MNYSIITPVSTEPITLADAKKHVRLELPAEDTSEDTTLNSIISAAREYCEKFTRRALATQTIELSLPWFPCRMLELPRPPIQSVISIKYYTSDGAEHALSADTDYLVDTQSEPGIIVPAYGKSWPSFTPYPIRPVRIRYVAGYTADNLMPKTIKQAMLLLIGYWYANREAVLTGSISKELEFAVKPLLSFHKAGWF